MHGEVRRKMQVRMPGKMREQARRKEMMPGKYTADGTAGRVRLCGVWAYGDRRATSG